MRIIQIRNNSVVNGENHVKEHEPTDGEENENFSANVNMHRVFGQTKI